MSLEHLPADIEQGVQRYADALHISHDEAVLKLLETGLKAKQTKARVKPRDEQSDKPGELLLGIMSSPEDAKMMDEIVAEAMQARRQRWERLSRA